jgi:hypothetical protein
MVPKPFKTTLRPLGLPDFDCKIVQEAIRMVLESIYEPHFQSLECNFGFRPKRDCLNAIHDIKKKAQGSDYAIEADFIGAYNNVDHLTLIKILKQKIKDNKFIRLIWNGLKSGFLFENEIQPTPLGVPQGGIASPILFNIYLHELDIFVLEKLTKKIDEKYNKIPQPEISTAYATNKSALSRARSKLKNSPENIETKNFPNFPEIVSAMKINPSLFLEIPFVKNGLLEQIHHSLENNLENSPLFSSDPANRYSKYTAQIRRAINKSTTSLKETIYSHYLMLKEYEVKKIINERKEIPYYDIDKKVQKIYYIRYADDLIIFIRGNKETTDYAYKQIKEFSSRKLKLEFSTEKTLITKLTENAAKFLGYTISFPRHRLITSRLNTKTNTSSPIASRPIIIGIDKERLENRFKAKKMLIISKDNFNQPKDVPRELGYMAILEDHEIIQKYNETIIGLGQYYIPLINFPGKLNRWINILYYSCIKTLATKHKLSVHSIITKYGYTDISISQNKKILATDRRIVSIYNIDSNVKHVTLLNYKETMYKLLTHKQNWWYNQTNNYIQPFTPTYDFKKLDIINTRTKFKFTQFCGICGATPPPPLHNHHIKPLRNSNGNFTGYKSFDRLVASLNRKQITIFSKCHTNIHNGTYDKLSLDEIYDHRINTIEGYIKNPTPNNINTPPTKKHPKSIPIYDDKNKTYLNIEYKEFIQNSKNTTNLSMDN